MIEKLKSDIVQDFILNHQHDDPVMLMLKAKKYPALPIREIVQQIQARQKAAQKLPEWHTRPGIIFPPSLSMEQCSSEVTARFKSSQVTGESLIDLTGGAGIDSYYFGKAFANVTYVEKNAVLCEIARHNFDLLSANVSVFNEDAYLFLSSLDKSVDLIFLDPARRDEQMKKVFLLEDCEPNVVALQQELLDKANQVLVKTSPMLDIQQAENSLQNVKAIYVVAVANEVKEVLYLLERDWQREALVYTVNLSKNSGIVEEEFTFTRSEEQRATSLYGDPEHYLYEPNNAILKAGGFKIMGNHYSLLKLHPHSHLYTSEQLINFPGRAFECIAVVPYQKKSLKAYLPDNKANISIRNFPDSVAVIRKKTGIKEGGDIYIFGTTTREDKLEMLICKKASAPKKVK